jgi:hypothetical protein
MGTNVYARASQSTDGMSPYGRELDARYDNLFKTIVSSGWSEQSDGDVESPQGYFAVVEIPYSEAERQDMANACDLGWDHEDWPDPGWYVTTETDRGLIWVYEFASSIGAHRRYDALVKDYGDWASDDGDEGCEGHESLNGADMGRTVYCDGSCRA